MKKILLASLTSGLLFIESLLALPSQVIVMRHAEKPAVGNELSTRGWERAAALAPYLLRNHQLLKFGAPSVLIAAGQKRPTSSVRSIQTLQPLARALNIKVQTQFKPDQYEEMVQYVKDNPSFQGRVVAIAWEHHSLPALVHALGVNPQPPHWSGDVFDRLWVVTYLPDGSVDFQDIPQRLLFGDSPN